MSTHQLSIPVKSYFLLRIRHFDCFFFFFLNDTAPTEISPLPLHDALPISNDTSMPPTTPPPNDQQTTLPGSTSSTPPPSDQTQGNAPPANQSNPSGAGNPPSDTSDRKSTR